MHDVDERGRRPSVGEPSEHPETPTKRQGESRSLDLEEQASESPEASPSTPPARSATAGPVVSSGAEAPAIGAERAVVEPDAERSGTERAVVEPGAAPRLRGIHHITAICSNLESTVAFYRDLLGLTLLKRTTNDDDPGARHFYFGDPEATPGTMVTFLEYPSMEAGQIGVGVVHHFALRTGSLQELERWYAHLRAHGVQCTEPLDRTYYSSIYFRDPDGNIVEIATDGPGLVIE